MPARRCTHIFFDFFGTLVDHSVSNSTQEYARSYAALQALDVNLTYQQFRAAWLATFAEFNQRAETDGREFSMLELHTVFLSQILSRRPRPAEVSAFTEQYVAEWSSGIVYLPGLADLLADLRGRYRLAVVSNTHHANLVPTHLAGMGLAGAFDPVITSVEVGWRKPHPAIYQAALDQAGADATSVIFVGDTYTPDFAGPRQAGMHAFLIDPAGMAPVPAASRLTSIFDLPSALERLGHG